jgi:hypothetical protein
MEDTGLTLFLDGQNLCKMHKSGLSRVEMNAGPAEKNSFASVFGLPLDGLAGNAWMAAACFKILASQSLHLFDSGSWACLLFIEYAHPYSRRSSTTRQEPNQCRMNRGKTRPSRRAARA